MPVFSHAAVDGPAGKGGQTVIAARVAILTNRIPPHQKAFYAAVGSRVRELSVFLSCPSHAERSFGQDAGFQVIFQKSVVLPVRWVHPIGFTDPAHLVLPYDTGQQLRKYRPDVVISAECGLRSLQGAVYCLRQTRCPFVVWATLSDHTEVGRGRLRSITRRWLFRRAAAVFVNGQSGRRYVEHLGCDGNVVTQVPYAVTVQEFSGGRPGSLRTRARRLLYVGQLNERKGILPFAESLTDFCTNNPTVPVELTIAGTGPLEERLKKQVLGGAGTIRFLGAVPYPALPAIYASADIFVLPTLADEWALVVNEAMASGLPVLGSIYSQAVEELVEDGVTGWVFHPDDREESMSRLNQALFASSRDLDEMGALAARRISLVTPEASAEQMVSTIATLLQ